MDNTSKKKRTAKEGLYDTLTHDGTDVPPAKEDYTLEEILAEYGGSLEDQLLREAEEQSAQAPTDAEPPAEPPPEPAGTRTGAPPAKPEGSEKAGSVAAPESIAAKPSAETEKASTNSGKTTPDTKQGLPDAEQDLADFPKVVVPTLEEILEEARLKSLKTAKALESAKPEIPEEAQPETLEEAKPEIPEEAPEETIPEILEETQTEAPKETIPEILDETQTEAPEETIPEILEKAQPEAPEEMIPEILEEAPPEATEETIPEILEEAQPEAPEETIPEILEEAQPEAPEETIPEILEETQPEAPEVTISKILEEAQPETPEETISKILEEAQAGPLEEDAVDLSKTKKVVIPPKYKSEAPKAAKTEPLEETRPEEAKPDTPQIPDTVPAASVLDDPIQAAEAAAAIDVEQLDLPESPRPISLEEVVNSTVEAVMEEGRQEPIKRQKRRGLFSRKKLEDSERLPPPPEPEPEYDPEPIGPEPDLQDAARASRTVFLKRKKPRLLQLVPALIPSVLLLADNRGIEVPLWSEDPKLQTVLLLACLLLTAVLCRHVFARAFEMLRQRRIVAELLACLSVLAAAADCIVRLGGVPRTDAMPYASVACLGLVFAQWGVRRESRGTFDMFRCAAFDDEPPYLVTDTIRGACKQRGSVPGFFTAALRDDFSTLLQTALLPVFGVAAFVFAGLSSFGQERNGDFFLNLSAILPAAATFSLPLCWSLPWSKLAERLQKTGAAVAGWSGAQKISRKRTMIVTDSDLFPPGTLQENGRKLYGEEPVKATAYAASMAKTAGSGLEFLFHSLMRAENGRYEEVDEFSFYEEGGYSGVIHGETVLMGTNSFMRKMEIRLPGGLNLKNGIFLAIDRHLVAIFAVKYNPAENVDFALKMMRRCHITPVLASRDPNITPALIRQKFSRGVKMEFPDLSERVALSEAEKDRDLPRALLFREGLLPYAEAVAGSQRLCGTVRRSAILSVVGSWLGVLLSFYLLSLGAYSLLTPLALEVFLLLWTLPVLLLSDGAGRY